MLKALTEIAIEHVVETGVGAQAIAAELTTASKAAHRARTGMSHYMRLGLDQLHALGRSRPSGETPAEAGRNHRVGRIPGGRDGWPGAQLIRAADDDLTGQGGRARELEMGPVQRSLSAELRLGTVHLKDGRARLNRGIQVS